MLTSEIGTLECVYHPNILRLFEVVETMGRVYLITEWVRGGELYNHITQNGPIAEVRAALLFKQLLGAVKHMHSLGFVHRDIKAENVLLLSEDCLKLADFGFSTQLINGPNQKLNTFCGSPPYAAPELFSDDHYMGAPVDVWALGVLLYFMVVGNMPFRAPTIPGLKLAILKGDYLLPGQLSLPCMRLIQRILVHLPSRRPTIDELFNCQFLLYPKLSEKLMQLEINLQIKSSSWGLWMRNKTQRMRKTQTLRERYVEVVSKPPICLNTRNKDGIFNDNFLHPIEINCEAVEEILKDTNKLDNTKRASFFYGTLRKKIRPLDLDKKQQTVTKSDVARWNVEMPVDCTTFKNYDLEIGRFVMLPSETPDPNQMSSIELEARQILEKLGIDNEMLQEAAPHGPRSDIIGAYRIVVNRLQKQAWLSRKSVETALQNVYQSNKKERNSCCIL